MIGKLYSKEHHMCIYNKINIFDLMSDFYLVSKVKIYELVRKHHL